MCGRFSMTMIARLLEEETGKKVPEDYKPSYNVAPSQNILVDNGFALAMQRWGYQPEWASKGVINAMQESLNVKPFWRGAKRCAVLADGFYEWKKTGEQKTPYRITPDALFCFAAVYDDKTNTVAIVTTEPNSLMKPIHNRMPIMLEIKDSKAWIDDAKIKQLAEKKLRAYKVSPQVNNPRNNSPEILVEIK